jgi:HK97 family phage major capsid protein
MSLSTAAIYELHGLQIEADGILAQSNIGKSEQKRADVLISRMASIRSTGLSSDELFQSVAKSQAHRMGYAAPKFRAPRTPQENCYEKFLRGASIESLQREFRDAAPSFVTGAAVLGYSQGENLGFVVPMQYHAQIVEGQKLISPLLNPDVVTVVQEPDFTLRPLQVPEWDLSNVSATLLGEIVGQTPSAIPTLQQLLLNKFRFNTSFNASLEWEQDASTAYGVDPLDALSYANGVALARGINHYLVNGDGVTGPGGILQCADSGVTTTASNVVGYDDLVEVFYSIDKAYRNAPKCAWLVTDAVEKQIRKLKDDDHRPLFPISDGILQVFGKPVHVAPDLPNFNASLGTQSAGSFCVFGDLSKYVVHASAVLQRRFMQTPGLIEAGLVRFHSQQMIDAVVCEPSPNGTSAIVSARLKS